MRTLSFALILLLGAASAGALAQTAAAAADPLAKPTPPAQPAAPAAAPVAPTAPPAAAPTAIGPAVVVPVPPAAETVFAAPPIALPAGADASAVATSDAGTDAAADPGALPPAALASDPDINILGQRVTPGSRMRVMWRAGTSFIGDPMDVPVVIVHGLQPGPVLCLTGGIHGDELNGVEVIRRVMASLDAQTLVGTVIGVPIVNMAGFSRGSRYLPDRRDLNRFFPGNPNGSSASRIAHDFFSQVIRRCSAVIDFHTGSFDRANLPQVRGDMRIPSVVELTRGFGATAVLHTPGAPGMLRRAATDRGIPAVTFELGAPVRLEPAEIEHGVNAIETLLNNYGMTQRVRMWREPQPIFYESRWVRAPNSGMLFADVRLGDRVRQGQRLGRIINPLNDDTSELVAPIRGRILGMALNQVVLPGYAAFHIGEEASEAQVIRDATIAPTPTVETERMDEGAAGADAPTEGSTEQVEEFGGS